MSKIPISLSEDFEEKLQALKRNYPYSIMNICGLQPKQMDFAGYIRDFCESNSLADSSVDGTSNQTAKDVVGLENDIYKPIFKMIAYNKIHTKMSEKYGSFVADDWLASEYLGKSYLHDAWSSTLIPYCYAYDLTKLAKEGLFFLNYTGTVPYNNQPAQHLDTFINHVKEFVSFTSNRQAGACGLPNLILWMFYFFKKDAESGYNGCHVGAGGKLGIEDYEHLDYNDQNVKYFSQAVQSFIYAVNQPYLRNSVQSAFTNISIFDHEYAHALFDGVEFPDGTLAIDYIDQFVEIQKLFMSVVATIRRVSMFTFPVISISLLTEDHGKKTAHFKDEKFAKWASDHNTQWFDSNIFLDSTVTSLSNCPLDGATKILFKDGNRWRIKTMTYLWNRYGESDREFTTFSNGQPVKVKINCFEEKPDWKIRLCNGMYINTTANHLNKVRGKDYVPTKDLTTEDFLPFTKYSMPYTRDNKEGFDYACFCLSEDTEDIIIFDDDYFWVRVKSCEQYETTKEVAYCLQVVEEGQVPEFTLANGLVTHNCRLKSDITDFLKSSEDDDDEEIWCHEDGTPATSDEIAEFLAETTGEA